MENNPRIFYEKLAALLYAIAVADDKLVFQEKTVIRDLIEEQWNVWLENEESKEVMYATLRDLIKEQVKKEEAFAEFETYWNSVGHLYYDGLVEKIKDSAYKVASGYAKRNKSELVLLYQLHEVLQKK